MKHPDHLYLQDPFSADDSEVACKRVKLVKGRKQYSCFTLGDGTPPHIIEAGELHRYESALIDSDYWGQYRVCLNCMNKFIELGTEEDED